MVAVVGHLNPPKIFANLGSALACTALTTFAMYSEVWVFGLVARAAWLAALAATDGPIGVATDTRNVVIRTISRLCTAGPLASTVASPNSCT